MSKSYIFISHSAKEPQTKGFLDLLSTTLKQDPTFDVWVDMERLQPGNNWRDDIYTALGLCHGAVILLSPSAVRKHSIWVPRESSILLWRRALDPSFVVIPVYLGNVTPNKVKGNLFADLDLNQLQAVPVGTNQQKVVQAIRQRFEKLRGTQGSSPLGELADKIVVLLEGIDDCGIQEALKYLNVPHQCQWRLQNNSRHDLALTLLEVDLEKSAEAICKMLDYKRPSCSKRR